MPEPAAPPPAGFAALAARRFSCRAYRPDPVPRALIEQTLEAARQAPSACNRQPWRFAVAERTEDRLRILQRGLLPGMKPGWIAGAPVLIALGIRRETATHRLAPLFSRVDYPWIDAGIAGEHLVLQAAELGLGTCWIGWIRPGGVRRAVGWPRAIRPVALIALGWPADPEKGRTSSRLAPEDLITWLA